MACASSSSATRDDGDGDVLGALERLGVDIVAPRGAREEAFASSLERFSEFVLEGERELCLGILDAHLERDDGSVGELQGGSDAWESSCPALQHPSDGPPVHMSSLSIWWQVPQFLLIGCGEIAPSPELHAPRPISPDLGRCGEIFTAITSYELFYSQVPPHMRSVCQSINLLCTSFGALAAESLKTHALSAPPGPARCWPCHVLHCDYGLD